jgi:serine/threonine protein kinase
MIDMVRTLKYIHEKGIVHLNVHAGSVFITSPETFKLSSFHHSMLLDHETSWQKRLRDTKGSTGQTSPELFYQNMLTKKSDIWGVGVIMHQLCTLRHRHAHKEPLVRYENYCE